YRKVANSDILEKVIDLPEGLRNKEVEILIFPYEENRDDYKKSANKNMARGLLGKYKSSELRGQEDGAWAEVVKEKYRSEEHTSELQSRFELVCRLLLE